MTFTIDIPEPLKARIEAIAARSTLSPSEVIADALSNGYSLEWQERFLDRVEQARSEAERGEFADSGDIARVLNKYRST